MSYLFFAEEATYCHYYEIEPMLDFLFRSNNTTSTRQR